MNEQPAGWYPDPFAAEPGATRYWDGERWTSSAQAPQVEPQPAQWREADAAGRGERRSFGFGFPGAAGASAQTEPWQLADDRGQLQLAGWGRRVAAYLLDAIPMIVLTMIMLQMLGVVDAMNAALEAGDAVAIDEVNAMLGALSPVGITVSVANLLFAALYNIGFHVARGATPGKMLLGIRVRRVDEDRNPELRGASLRWLVQFGPGMLNSLPLLGFVSGIFTIADHLWPIWDPNNQAFHDKAGRTVVVRSR